MVSERLNTESLKKVLHSFNKSENIRQCCILQLIMCIYIYIYIYIWGADNSLARPGRKQATATEDFDVHVSYLLS